MWSRKGSTGSQVLVLDVEGMHCGSCGLTIDDAVEDVPHVSRSTTSFKNGTTEAVLAAGADREQVGRQVLDAVATAGYRASLRTG